MDKYDAMSATEIANVLSYDALAEAERITGASYKEDDETMRLGVGMHMQQTERKRALLALHGDTLLTNDHDRYTEVLREEGFRKVLDEPFSGKVLESFQVWWHEDGLMLTFDTFGGGHINSAKLLFNWRAPNEERAWPPVPISGHVTEGGVAIAGVDAREALRLKIFRLRQAGSFVRPWVERPFMWLLGYEEAKSPGGPDRREERIARLPKDIQEAIGAVS